MAISSPETAGSGADVPPAPDEMHDSPRDHGRPGRLGEFLRACDPRPAWREPSSSAPVSGEKSLREAFDEVDGVALDQQARHLRTTRRAANFTMVALIVALTLLSLAEFGRWFGEVPAEEPIRRALTVVEAFFALGCVGFVILGLLHYRHEEWLLNRYKAERYRLLKFRSLVDPRMWREVGTSGWKERLALGVQEIGRLSRNDIDALTTEETVPSFPSAEESAVVEPESLERLLDFYCERRLNYQIGYFYKKSLEHTENPRLLPLLFFSSSAIVLAHLLFEGIAVLMGHPKRESPGIGTLLLLSTLALFLSVVVPVILTASRTKRGALERARNIRRSRARFASLATIAKKLSDERSGERDPHRIFGYLYLAEFILSADTHEWMRLMREAEWYGA